MYSRVFLDRHTHTHTHTRTHTHTHYGTLKGIVLSTDSALLVLLFTALVGQHESSPVLSRMSTDGQQRRLSTLWSSSLSASLSAPQSLSAAAAAAAAAADDARTNADALQTSAVPLQRRSRNALLSSHRTLITRSTLLAHDLKLYFCLVYYVLNCSWKKTFSVISERCLRMHAQVWLPSYIKLNL